MANSKPVRSNNYFAQLIRYPHRIIIPHLHLHTTPDPTQGFRAKIVWKSLENPPEFGIQALKARGTIWSLNRWSWQQKLVSETRFKCCCPQTVHARRLRRHQQSLGDTLARLMQGSTAGALPNRKFVGCSDQRSCQSWTHENQRKDHRSFPQPLPHSPWQHFQQDEGVEEKRSSQPRRLFVWTSVACGLFVACWIVSSECSAHQSVDVQSWALHCLLLADGGSYPHRLKWKEIVSLECLCPHCTSYYCAPCQQQKERRHRESCPSRLPHRA